MLCRRCFFPDGENPLEESEPFRIPNLDQTYEAIAEQGARDLYEGDLAATFAREIARELAVCQLGKTWRRIGRPVREPIALHSRGFQLALNPPPAVGGAAVGCLINMVESNWRDAMSAAERASLQARFTGAFARNPRRAALRSRT